MGDKVQRTEGKDLKEAILKFKRPDTITARGSIRIIKDGKEVITTPMSVLRLKMMFNKTHSFREIFIKNLSLFIK